MREDPNIMRVKFDKKIEIMQFGITELSSVVAARYNGSMLIPNRNSPRKIELGDKAFIFKPEPYFETVATYHERFQRVDIYAVNILPINIIPTEVIIETETGKDMEIFENVFVPKNLLGITDKSSIGKVLIRKPDKKHNDYLVLVKIEDENIRELFQVFFEKNPDYYQIKLLNREEDDDDNSGNLLEIIMSGGIKIEKVKELIMIPFHTYFDLKSEV